MVALPDRSTTANTSASLGHHRFIGQGRLDDLPDSDPGDVVGAAALLLVEQSDKGWVRLLTEHVDDGSGHCAACGRSRAAPVWPCSLWSIGQHAQLLAEQRRRSAGRR